MKSNRMIAALNQVSLPDDRKEAMLERILEQAAFLEKEQEMHSTSSNHRICRKTDPSAGGAAKRGRRAALRWLVPVAAILLVAGVLFAIPGVSRAVSGWLISLFRLERYLEAGHNDAEVNPDIEQVITRIDAFGQSYEILLLDEIPATDSYSFAGIDEWRVKQGQKPFARSDWAWLTELRPEIREVLYDGKNLIITTFYGCDDPAPFARGYLGRADGDSLSLDIVTFDCTMKVNGQELPPCGYATSLDFSKWYPRCTEPGFSLDELKADGGVYGMTTFELPDAPGLPDGQCEIELIQSVQDDSVDNLSVIGMVAQIIHRFRFDTTAGNAGLSETALDAVHLTGSAPYTVTYFGSDGADEAPRIVTQTVDLSGISITPLVSRRSTGIHIRMQFSYPDRPELADAELRLAIERSTDYELTIDGAPAGLLDALGAPGASTVEISLTPSELGQIRSIVLSPVAVSYSVIAGRDMTKGDAIPLPSQGSFSYDPCQQQETRLACCDIQIPLE